MVNAGMAKQTEGRRLALWRKCPPSVVGSAGRAAYLVYVIWHGKAALVLLRRS